MIALLAVTAGLAGLVVGSFLEVVAERVPSKLPVDRFWPTCTSCTTGAPLRLPVVSWVVQRGRCPNCRVRTGIRRPLLELACGTLFAATVLRFGVSYHLPAYLVLGAGLVALAAVDLQHQLLPNRIVYPTGIAVGALLFLAALADADPRLIAWALIGAVGSFGLFLLLHLIQPSGMAFGDVRLSFVLGMATGWLGLSRVPLFLFSSFVFAAVVGLVFAAVSGRGLKALIPFGPFLVLGAELAIFVPSSLADSYLGI